MVDVAERMATLLPQREVASFCHRWKIHELSLFGSVLRDDFGPASDIDVLVTFDDDAQTSGLCHLTGMIARTCGTC